MRVYAFYDSSPSAHPEQAEFLRLWALSWERRGFTPKLLTARHAQRSSFYSRFIQRARGPELTDYRRLQWLALHAVRGSGWLTSSRVINFSLAPKRMSKKTQSMRVNASSWPTFRVSRASTKSTVAYMMKLGGWLVATEPFPPGLKQFECAADVLNHETPI